MATVILDNIGSGNGLLPDGTKPSPEPMLTYHQQSSDKHLWAISREIPHPYIDNISMKIAYRKFQEKLSGVNELTFLLYR